MGKLIRPIGLKSVTAVGALTFGIRAMLAQLILSRLA